MRLASTSAIAQARAYSRIRTARTSRRSAGNFLESRRPTSRRLGSSMTAAATTWPKREPRPTSSSPAILCQPHWRASRSNREEHRFRIAADFNTAEFRMRRRFMARTEEGRGTGAARQEKQKAQRKFPWAFLKTNARFEFLGFFFSCHGFRRLHTLDTLQARRLALQPAQIIQLGAADAALAQHLDGTNGRRVRRKNALDPDSKAHPPHGEARARRFPALF